MMQKFLKNIYLYDWLVLGYTAFAVILSHIIGFRIDFRVMLHFQYDITFLKIMIPFLIVYMSALALRYRKEGKDECIFGRYWRARIKERYFKWRNIVDLLRVLLLLKLTLLVYCNIKQAIPFINPLLYDRELVFLDKFIHLGINPNLLTVSLLGGDFFTPLMDKIYVLWYILNPLILVFFAILPDRKIHRRFFASYFALWIYGGLFAVMFPSLGPIYCYPSWFKNLKMPFASSLQGMLLNHYNQALADPEKYKIYNYEGIAAFPSLHVAVAALFAFFFWKVNRTAGIIIGVYTVLIQSGSVLLGWHYAVDGYFGILLAFAFYKFSGIFFRYHEEFH